MPKKQEVDPFAGALTEAINRSGVSREEIGKALGVGRVAIYKHEWNGSGIRLSTLRAICKAIGMEVRIRIVKPQK